MESQGKLSKSVFRVALATGAILCIPLVAMQFTDEVNWGIGDFVVMGMLLFGTGMSFVLLTRLVNNFMFRIASAVALASVFLMVWINLAVGLIGSGPNAGNWMYLGVLVLGVVGTIFFRLTPKGMERVMYTMAVAVALIAAIALITHMDRYPGSSVKEIIGINGFLATLFGTAGLLFRYAAMAQNHSTEKSNV